MKKFLLFSLFFLLLASPGLALTTTPTATPSTEIQDKIKSLVKENLQTTENILQKNLNPTVLLGFTGTVKSVGSKNLTLEIESDIFQVVILPTTKITKDGTEIKSSAIALTDKLLVIGTKTNDDVLEAKVINVILPEDQTTIVLTKAALTTITNIDLKKKTFTLTIKDENLSFTLSKKSTVKLEDFKNGDRILAITKKYLGKYSLSRAKKI